MLSMDVLRLSFYNAMLSPEERITAGKRYLDDGGNGGTAEDVNKFILKHPDIYKGVTAAERQRN
jgi:hypothetical protein